MPINAGKMEILRDFWNATHHEMMKLEQIRQITPIPIHLDAELELHYRIEKILLAYENDDDDDERKLSLSAKKNIHNGPSGPSGRRDDDDNNDPEVK